MDELTPETIIKRFEQAKNRRSVWESHWQECYDYALPRRSGAISEIEPGEKKQQRLFDGTAGDAIEQLAASLMGELTPAWARWFDLVPGYGIGESQSMEYEDKLNGATEILQYHFDRSNIIVELHQCFLDLATIGTACLLLEEAPLGHKSAFRFTAVPMVQAVFEEGINGRLDTTFRKSELTESQLLIRFPNAKLPDHLRHQETAEVEGRYTVIEAVIPDDKGMYQYQAVLYDGLVGGGAPVKLAEGRYNQSPFINFRWLKTPGEEYGRSPMMKVLPDVKTANKVVELILKNATISVTGIWQADDDGVLNPATIKLVPGSIIPKAVGSGGLQPLKSPAEFNTSQLVLEDLRNRIRHGLLADQFTSLDSPRMTATEVLQRSAVMSQLLGATYGRLHAELLLPLAERAISILRRRGEIAGFEVDGHMADVQVVSPLAQKQRQRRASSISEWLQIVNQLGPEAAKWFADAYDVPANLIKKLPVNELATTLGSSADLASQIGEVLMPNVTSQMPVEGGLTNAN